jgi:hypothetical protein
MGFLVKLFTRKGNLAVMNNLYHKIAVTFACTALSFTLVANKEAQAATFTLSPPATQFFIEKGYFESFSSLVFVSPNENNPVLGIFTPPDFGDSFSSVLFSPRRRPSLLDKERRAFYEFNISNLSLAPNTVIRKVTFQQYVESAQRTNSTSDIRSFDLEIFGYVGNGKPDLSDFGNGVSLDIKDVAAVVDRNLYSSDLDFYYSRSLRFDVTTFFKEQVKNGGAFAGFGIRPQDQPYNNSIGFPNYGGAILKQPYLIIETEPVPEPTTIFGSALALGVGGWLKRKKSGQQNKATPH